MVTVSRFYRFSVTLQGFCHPQGRYTAMYGDDFPGRLVICFLTPQRL
jgi:hypothetical protein